MSDKIINILPIDVEERLNRGEKLQIIDVREDAEVTQGKIPTAKHIRLSEIADRIKEIDPSREAIMVCRSGGRSTKACEYLMSQGYKNIKNLMGGMLAWTGETE